jgi:hypothetical protein
MKAIRTTDRMNFKRCRQSWDFGSKLRQNYEPLRMPKALDFGTAFHKALEVYYSPLTWGDENFQVRVELSKQAFRNAINEHRTRQLKITGDTELIFELEQDFQERLDLGLGMLENYYYYSKYNDNFKPIAVELDFEVPISIPEGYRSHLANRFHEFNFDGMENILQHNREPVVYQGRIDLLVEDEKGRYIIVDHKTASQFGDLTWLALDEQCTSYGWALQHVLGLEVSGIMYNQVRKKSPVKPTVLKNGTLSQAKNADTTAELFISTAQDLNHDLNMYSDYIAYLESNPKEFIRRTFVRRTEEEYKQQSIRIFLEALEMIQSPLIYPNPSSMNCNGCMFFAPCSAKQSGGDVEFLLKEMYRKREE